MEHNVQNVTLSLTLPISCHICLGKVRQPVICVNHHVFCSSCIDLWLKNNNQCPACRVPITPDHPCKDIIGGTSENERVLSHSVRKHLRKTRLDLLQKEYEDEIEYLLKETEELRRTNLSLEKRLNEVADPIAESSPCSCGNRQAEDKSSVCNKLLEDWNRKLEEVNAANKRVTEDIDKFKEENRRLKNENIDIVRENLRLKNEVELRSPQKFGRFTVAALQAKVDQYEREMSRLKKALERSDQYIEELEAQIVHLKRPPEDKQIKKSQCGNTALMEEHTGRAATSHVCQDIGTIDSKGICPISVRLKQTQSKTIGSPKLKNGLHTTVLNDEEQTSLARDNPSEIMVSMSQGRGSPSSSIPFGSLQLNTPNCKTSSLSNANLKKPLTYLRKLVFDDLPRRRELGRLAPAGSEYNVSNADGATQPGQTNAVFSHFCHIKGDYQDNNSEKADPSLQLRKQGRNAADQFLSRLHSISGEDLNQAGTSRGNTADVNLNYDSVDPNNSVSHLESQENLPHSSVSCLTPDWVKQFQSDSPVHMCESSEKTTLSHHESSLFNSLSSSSLAENEEQPDLFMAQSSTDGYNIDFNNHLHSNNLPCEEEVRPHAYSDKVLIPGYISEPACPSSSLPQMYCGSPPAKRKLLNRSKKSPSKSPKL